MWMIRFEDEVYSKVGFPQILVHSYPNEKELNKKERLIMNHHPTKTLYFDRILFAQLSFVLFK